VRIFRILELTPDAFDEEEVIHLKPDPAGSYPHDLHHLVVEPDRIVLDGKRTRFDPLFWLRRLFRER
jgi:hypothetical protein